MNNNPTEKPRPSGISRRTVVKGAAWAVPAITVASAVPAVAASGTYINLTGQGCKLPGASNETYKGYAFELTASNTGINPVTITITSIVLDGDNLGSVSVVNLAGCTSLGNPFTVPAGTTFSNLAAITANAGDSENGTLVVTYTVSGQPGTFTVTAAGNGSPPINGASCGIFTPSEKVCLSALAL